MTSKKKGKAPVEPLDDAKTSKQRSKELREMMTLYRDSKDRIKRAKMGMFSDSPPLSSRIKGQSPEDEHQMENQAVVND